jgi:hypothetical protein
MGRCGSTMPSPFETAVLRLLQDEGLSLLRASETGFSPARRFAAPGFLLAGHLSLPKRLRPLHYVRSSITAAKTCSFLWGAMRKAVLLEP